MIFIWVLLVSLRDANMKACDSEPLTTFESREACESYATRLKNEMLERGQAGAVNCYDKPKKNPVHDSAGQPYEDDGRDT